MVSEDNRVAEIPERQQASEEAVRLGWLRRTVARLDAQPRLLSAARRLRHRLPGDEKFGDPLSTAGANPVQVIARGVSAFQLARDSVTKELGLAGLQLWQSLSEASGRGRGDAELALLFTDLVGFSAWALKVGDAAALDLLRQVGTVVETAVLDHDGRIIKRLGDGLMATFLDAQQALDAALEAQAALSEVEIAGYEPRLRAGVHWGRPRKLGGDYLGVDVNIAARVADAAKAQEVLVSDRALERMHVDGLQLGRAKRLKAQGAPRELRVLSVSRE